MRTAVWLLNVEQKLNLYANIMGIETSTVVYMQLYAHSGPLLLLKKTTSDQ